jgi:hypothetical protein
MNSGRQSALQKPLCIPYLLIILAVLLEKIQQESLKSIVQCPLFHDAVFDEEGLSFADGSIFRPNHQEATGFSLTNNS